MPDALADLPVSELTGRPARVAAVPITVASGDGIGPEITAATLVMLSAAGAQLDADMVEVGEKRFLAGETSGIGRDTWDSIARTGVMLKGPITTPQGGGYKSLNVTMRKTLGLYANVRPCRTYKPLIASRHPDFDVVIVRENEEDLYAGIEHRQTEDVRQCLKLITRSGSERILRHAFELTRAQGRRRLTCMTKDNIMKLTDGLFHKVFDELAAEYPEIETQHQIIDFGMANFVDRPESYDVIVLPNLYGDILSDVAAQMTGSVGLGGSVNLGTRSAIFEAIHGSAPDLPPDAANPSGMLLAGIELLRHVGQHAAADRAYAAWLCTIEDGVHTADIAGAHTAKRVGTRGFTDAVIERMGCQPRRIGSVRTAEGAAPGARRPSASKAAAATRAASKAAMHTVAAARADRKLVGVDVFLRWSGGSPDDLGRSLSAVPGGPLTLRMMTNRGVKVWPQGHADTLCTDHWRCRFEGEAVQPDDVAHLLLAVHSHGLDAIKTENLYTFDGVAGYSLGQGQ